MKPKDFTFFEALWRATIQWSCVAAFCFVALAACDKAHKDPKRNESLQAQMNEGYRMIDRGYPDLAVQHFSRLITQYPNVDSVKISLASAYVARSGLHVADFAAFAQSFQGAQFDRKEEVKPLVQAALIILRQKQGDQEPDPLLEPMVTKFLENFVTLQEALRKLAIFPFVGLPQMNDLRAALDILATVNPENRGAQLYSGVMKLVLVKSRLVHRDLPPVLQMKSKDDCQLDLKAYEIFTKEIIGTAVSASDNFQKAFPSKALELEKAKGTLVAMLSPGDLNLEDMNASTWAPAAVEAAMNSPGSELKCEK
ncbi:MAG: hypothetical protein AB7O96_01800 [Pseudobdellovibrionaceae bacterium]